MAATIDQVQKLGITYILVRNEIIDLFEYHRLLICYYLTSELECCDRIVSHSLSKIDQSGKIRYYRFPNGTD